MQKVREKTDLSELNQRQEIIATQKLVEKITAFSLSNLYDGKLIKPQMKILLQDATPIVSQDPCIQKLKVML